MPTLNVKINPPSFEYFLLKNHFQDDINVVLMDLVIEIKISLNKRSNLRQFNYKSNENLVTKLCIPITLKSLPKKNF